MDDTGSSADESAVPSAEPIADRIADVSARADALAARVAELTEQDQPAPDPEPAAERGRVRRLSGWLFERHPPRNADGAAAAEPSVEAEPEPEPAPEPAAEPAPLKPAPISLALDAAEAAAETPTPAAPDFAPPERPDEAAEDAVAGQTEEPDEGEQPADEAGDPEVEGLKARPRPWSGAPVVYDKPAVSLSKASSGPAKADPIADFFARKDDDEGRRWFGRKGGTRTESAGASTKTDKPADKPSEKATEAADSKPWPKAIRRTVRFVVVVAIAVAAALLLRTYVVQPYYVPSQSMEPTLHGCPGCNDDHVLVEKLSYRFHDVKAGDIVVFHRPASWPVGQVPDDVLIKRVIGVAGDRLTLKHGRVFRNGQPLDEPYVNQKCRRGTTDKTGSIHKKAYPRVPNGEVFVMGDNRCDSEDSRFFGDVPTSDVIGRAFLIIWPVGRIHSLN
ncbi:MAG TPA: signal peptidase I [Jatrophihabitantaceae bacterium]